MIALRVALAMGELALKRSHFALNPADRFELMPRSITGMPLLLVEHLLEHCVELFDGHFTHGQVLNYPGGDHRAVSLS
jgi:hypothetical protein